MYTDTEDPVDLTATVVRESGLAERPLGIEKAAWFFTVADLERLQSLLPRARFVDTSGVVEQGRVVKSPAEIAYIRQAARAAEAAMRARLDATAAGKTENDVAAEIYHASIQAGSEYQSLPHFIASGYRSSLTHATWAGRRIEPGEVIYYEVSGCVRRYGAALFRCATIGPPNAAVKRMSDRRAGPDPRERKAHRDLRRGR